jgi:Tol biopolymer transport system component/DNA-binding winged helix-turn-helix (wHTH) protein
MSQSIKHLYEFGPFRLDAGERLLLRDGESVPLTPKAFDLLLTLVEHHGRLLEKEELLKKVWPDTFIEEANLSYNISLIRKALGDGENGHKFIETVPKRGYRFVAGVRELGARQAENNEAAARSNKEEAWPEPLTSKVKRHRKGALLALAVLVIAIGGIGFGVYKFITRSESKSSVSDPKIIPITSFPGSETQPAFSPDANQIAFVWDGPQEDNPDIYVKLVDAGEPLRLTTNPAPDLNPVWSPDGRYIAFTRAGAGGGIYLVPALGGAERKLAEIFPERPFSQLSLSYSPDGKYLAVADKTATMEPYSIFLLATETGEKRRLTFPPAGPEGDDSPAFSPDGRSLVFARSHSHVAGDLYVVPLAGGEPTRLTSDNSKTGGISWTADGREIVRASIRGGVIQYLWKVPLTGGAPERLSVFAPNLSHPSISRQGNRLAWAQSMEDLSIWRVEINPATGQAGAPAKLIASSLGDFAPQFSPDGQKIAFGSRRTGRDEILVSDRNGANPIAIASLGKFCGTPRWSPDGRQIVFDSQVADNWDIYVVGANGGQPRRLTTDPAEETCGSWSRDGRWIYFHSSRSGSLQIWKMPAEGGQAVQVTRQGGFEGFESPDGRYFYYAKGRRAAGIWRIPVEGGAETLVLDHHRAGYWRHWAVTAQGIYFATAELPARPLIEFFSFATGKVTLVATIEKQIQAGYWGLAVSPDNRWVLYTQLDQRGSDIMLMENFR